MPLIEGGFADTQCVDASADFNILKTKATALARAEIAKQINIQVKAMDKTHDELVEVNDGTAEGSTFSSVSKQVTNQMLAGTRSVKIDYVDFPDNTQKLCSMVTMEPDQTKELFDGLVKASGKKLSAQNESVLYQEFKAHKAQVELEKEASKL